MANDYPNSGALFKADPAKKAENPKRPDYEGSAEVDGVDYWISAWIKEGKSGKFMSLAFKPKDERPAQRRPDADDIGW
jgi:hypothetical protein